MFWHYTVKTESGTRYEVRSHGERSYVSRLGGDGANTYVDDFSNEVTDAPVHITIWDKEPSINTFKVGYRMRLKFRDHADVMSTKVTNVRMTRYCDKGCSHYDVF